MAKIKNEFYIKDIFNSEDALAYYGSDSFYTTILNNESYSPFFATKDLAYNYYQPLKDLFDSNFDDSNFGNNSQLFVFFNSNDSDNLYYLIHGESVLYGTRYSSGEKRISFNTSYFYKFNINDKTSTSVSGWTGNLDDLTNSWYCLFSSVKIKYEVIGVGNRHDFNYLLSQDMQGKGQGGWQVPNPNPTRKIVINGSEPDDIKLNGVTPDKIMLNGNCYFEKALPPKQTLVRLNYTNTDSPTTTTVSFPDADDDMTIDNFFLDLKSYRFAGSQSTKWNSDTTLNSYSSTNKTLTIRWFTMSGSSQQNFDIVEVPDPSRLAVLQDWTVIDQGRTIELNLPSAYASRITTDDILIDFKEVHTYESLNGGSWITISRAIQNGKLILTIPDYFATNSYYTIRVLCSL